MRQHTLNYFRILILLMFGLHACEHADLTVTVPNENVRRAGDFVRNNFDFNLFNIALEYTGLAEELNGEGPFTLLAPTNLAFNMQGFYTAADIRRADRDSLRRVLSYHILPIRLPSADFPNNGVDERYLTLAGDELYATGEYSAYLEKTASLYFDGAAVSRMDVQLANGVLHAMSKMMKYHKGQTVQSWLDKQPRYTLFVQGLKKFGLWNQLADAGPFTVFAPTNAALEEAGINAQWLATVEASDYKGSLLVGAYIMYDRHFFLSDQDVLSSNWYDYFLKDGEGYSTSFYASSVAQGTSYTMSIRLPFEGSYYPHLRSTNTDGMADMDHRVENGVVHEMREALIYPDEARKTN